MKNRIEKTSEVINRVMSVGVVNVVNPEINVKKAKRKIKWSKFTGENIGRLVAIVLDDKVFMTPRINAKISTGGTMIQGFSGKQEAEDIASVLQAGELPAPIVVKQFNYIVKK